MCDSDRFVKDKGRYAPYLAVILEQFDNSLLRAHILYIYKLRSTIFISESKTRRHFVYDVIKRRQNWFACENLLISIQISVVLTKFYMKTCNNQVYTLQTIYLMFYLSFSKVSYWLSLAIYSNFKQIRCWFSPEIAFSCHIEVFLWRTVCTKKWIRSFDNLLGLRMLV